MGTSSSFGGTPSKSPLVPSWVADMGDTSTDVTPAAEPAKDQSDAPPETPAAAPDGDSQKAPSALPAAAPEGRFTVSRKSFNAFAKSGGTGGGEKLGKALSSYVSSGNGGRKGATARMAPSRKAATKLGGFIRAVERSGTAEALRQINCGDLVGKPAGEVLGQLVDSFCPEGGPIDESIARQAFQETVAEWADKDLPSIEQLVPEQWNELMIEFISRSIEIKIYEDIGNKSIEIATDAKQALNVQQEVHGVIEGCVRNAFNDRVAGFEKLSDREISTLMESVYERAWGFIEDVGGEQ